MKCVAATGSQGGPGFLARGITLIEALIALAVLVIITALAAPNFTQLLSSSKGKATAQDLQADLDLARSEAIRFSRAVRVCASSNGTACVSASQSNWAVGWIVQDVTSSTVRKWNNTVPSSLTVTGPASVEFRSIGQATVTASGSINNFSAFPTGSTVSSGFGVCLSGSGTSSVKKGGC